MEEKTKSTQQILIEPVTDKFISVFDQKITTPINIDTNKKILPSLHVPLSFTYRKRVDNLLSLIPQYLAYNVDGKKIISIDVISSLFKNTNSDNTSSNGLKGIIQFNSSNEDPVINSLFEELENPQKIKFTKLHETINFKAETEKKKVFFITLDIGFMVCIINQNYKKIILSLMDANTGTIGTITGYKPFRQLTIIQYAFEELDINFLTYNNFIEIKSDYITNQNIITNKDILPGILTIENDNGKISSQITHVLTKKFK